jgi:hypothetical protein
MCGFWWLYLRTHLARSLAKKRKVKFNPITEELTVNGMVISIDIFAKIFADNPRILWRFRMVGDRIEAIPIDERHVIWLDPKVL